MVVVLMVIGQSPERMGPHTTTWRHRVLGWLATGLTAIAVVVMLVTTFPN